MGLKKYTLTFLILLLSFSALAKFSPGKVYLKDSTVLNGFIKIKQLGGIKFKTRGATEVVHYNLKDLLGYDIRDKKYRYIMFAKDYPPKLLQEILVGKIILYSTQNYGPGLYMPTAGGGGMHVGGGSTSPVYYII